MGNDIIEIERIRKVYERHGERFLDHILTPIEKEECLSKNTLQYLAGRFAAKEAVAKALGTGIGEVGWKDIEILNEPSGRPFARVQHPSYTNSVLHVSISHTREVVTAVAIWER